jgi:hypothetical protein
LEREGRISSTLHTTRSTSPGRVGRGHSTDPRRRSGRRPAARSAPAASS